MSSNKGVNSADIIERLVGITPTYLNNFLQRKKGEQHGMFGLRASVQPGKRWDKRRLFSEDDVFGIALVWLLFETGLRTDPIVRTLKDICRKADVNLAAKKLREQQTEWISIERQPRRPARVLADKPEQTVQLLRRNEGAELLSERPVCRLFIPVGQKFRDIEHRMELLFGGENNVNL